MAAVTQDGRLGVWVLDRGVAVQPRIERGPVPKQSLALVDAPGSSAIWTCRAGELCATNLATGSEASLAIYGGDDSVVQGVSGPGATLVVGTQAGAILEFTNGLPTRRYKPRDVWSAGSAVPIYTLEASSDLSLVVSAGAEMGMESLTRRRGNGRFNPAEAWFEFVRSDGGVRRMPMWLGPVAWRLGSPTSVSEDSQTRVRADVSYDGLRFAVKDEGGPGFVVYDSISLRPLHELSQLELRHCNGLRFLDVQGRYLSSIAYSQAALSLVDLAAAPPSVVSLPLKNPPAGGARVLAAMPSRGWLFVGLQNAAIDWYEFHGDPGPEIVYKGQLRFTGR